MRAASKPENTQPNEEELKRLPSLHSILGALNDPAAGVPQLRRFCAELPALRARILREARHAAPDRDFEDVGYALAIIGNRGFEVVLLEYLEALTILKADTEEAQQAVAEEKSANLSKRPPAASL